MLPFINKKKNPLSKTEFDFIIVGGGSAGCVLANRLSANPNHEVCLLEAGPADTSFLIKMPLGIIALMRSKTLNWQFRTEKQTKLKNRAVFWPRGKTLGGSSAINAMIYTRGHSSDYDEWETMGNPGWGWNDLLPYFKKSQHQERGENAYHGINGPLNVADITSPNELSTAFVKAAIAAGYPENDDFNGAEQEGVGFYQVTQKNGQRWSAADAYLHPIANRSNLTIVTEALVTRIYTEKKRAQGITFTHKGETVFIKAKKEIILSGGAINSPQLLLLSGIGPKSELQKHGITQVHELPGVGKNLQDHLDTIVVQRSLKDVSFGLSRKFLLASLKHTWNYFRHHQGPFTSNAAEAGGFIKSDPSKEKPDLQFHLTAGILDDNGLTLHLGAGYSLHACDLRPISRGHVGLISADPTVAPRIEPNYGDAEKDLDIFVKAVKICRQVLAQSPFDNYRGVEIFPGKAIQSDDQIREFIRQKISTIYHPVGTCRMGVDEFAVVDSSLKVHGITGLRVVDASIMPKLIGGNTNAPTMMIAEKAADMILQDIDQTKITKKESDIERLTKNLSKNSLDANN